jgi:hypothetical protein
LIALWAAKTDIARAGGLDKIVTLSNLCFAIPLAVFGAEHFSAARHHDPSAQVYALAPVLDLFRGRRVDRRVLEHCHEDSGALVRPAVRLHDVYLRGDDGPAGNAGRPHNRINWVLLLRELSFGAGGWVLAGAALARKDGHGSKLITVGRIVIGIAAIFYGVEHFLHPVNVPGVPLEKLMPVWIPGRTLIGYLTGAILLVSGASILLAKKTRTAATYLGGPGFCCWSCSSTGRFWLRRSWTRVRTLRSRGSITFSTRCSMPERFSRSPMRRHAGLRLEFSECTCYEIP